MFDEPSRDPRGPTLSIAMWAVITADNITTDPAAATLWRGFDEHDNLAFDHDRIVAAARRILATSLLWRDTTFTRALLGAEFPATHAVTVTTALTGSRPDQAISIAHSRRYRDSNAPTNASACRLPADRQSYGVGPQHK